MRLVTLSNGSTEVAERLFAAAGIRDQFERPLSVDDAGVWKPAAGAYAYAARVCEADPGDMLLVAVHPWDIDGAKRAGLRTAWINREDQPYPGYFLVPDHSVTELSELAGTSVSPLEGHGARSADGDGAAGQDDGCSTCRDDGGAGEARLLGKLTGGSECEGADQFAEHDPLSMVASYAPRQRRVPPPKGIHVAGSGADLPTNRSGMKASGDA